MNGIARVLGTYFNHLCAFLMVVALFGAVRLIRSVRSLYGPAVWSQILVVAWLTLLVVATYMVPPIGVWGVGLVIPLFATNHYDAWVTQQLGPEEALRTTLEVMRKAGPATYVAMASTPHLLYACIGLIIVLVSVGRNSWEYWLGMGMLASGPMGALIHLLWAWRNRHIWRAKGAA